MATDSGYHWDPIGLLMIAQPTNPAASFCSPKPRLPLDTLAQERRRRAQRDGRLGTR